MPLKLQSWPLQNLPGLSQEHLLQLQSLGLKTTQDLLQKTRSPQNCESIARQLNIPLRYIRKWIALAELSQLPSVGCQYCGLLLHSGITSLKQLAAAAPGRLYSQTRRLHTMTMQRSDLCPTPDVIACWVQEAKQILARSPRI